LLPEQQVQKLFYDNRLTVLYGQSYEIIDLTKRLLHLSTTADWPKPSIQLSDITLFMLDPKIVRMLIDDLIAIGITMLAACERVKN
jgi:adenine/guanine phosphoribosyltransferase-like PRPP-binding protein